MILKAPGILRIFKIFSIFSMLYSVGCKNVTREHGGGPRHALDYSYVKFVTYNEAQVLSSGHYSGQNTKADVVSKALSDIKKLSNCGAGSQTDFCTRTGGEPVQWIQLFLPNGRSCGVGAIPQDVQIESCLDPS